MGFPFLTRRRLATPEHGITYATRIARVAFGQEIYSSYFPLFDARDERSCHRIRTELPMPYYDTGVAVGN